jgi:hypothetical protein
MKYNKYINRMLARAAIIGYVRCYMARFVMSDSAMRENFGSAVSSHHFHTLAAFFGEQNLWPRLLDHYT